MKLSNLKNKYKLSSKNFKFKFLGVLVILYGVLFFNYLHEFTPTLVSSNEIKKENAMRTENLNIIDEKALTVSFY